MEHIADKLTGRLLLRGYIETDQIEWCHYMVMRRCMSLLSFLTMVLVGAVIANLRAALVFTAAFRFLRIRTSGYHAKTPHACLLTALSVQCVALMLVRCFGSLLFYGVLAGFSVFAIAKLAPANNAAIHLTQDEIAALRPSIRMCTMAIFIMGCGAFMLMPDSSLGRSLIAALAADAFLLVLSAIGLGAQ